MHKEPENIQTEQDSPGTFTWVWETEPEIHKKMIHSAEL